MLQNSGWVIAICKIIKFQSIGKPFIIQLLHIFEWLFLEWWKDANWQSHSKVANEWHSVNLQLLIYEQNKMRRYIAWLFQWQYMLTKIISTALLYTYYGSCINAHAFGVP